MFRPRPLTSLVASASLSLAACGPPRTEVQDSAFLVPLDQAAGFIPGSEVLPRSLFDRGHPLTVTDEPETLYAKLAVVAVRLDPCFREGGAKAGECLPQLRLVLQPVFEEGGAPTTRDAAVHVFFTATLDEIHTAVRALARARSELGVQAAGGLTGPHPGLLNADFRKRAKAALQPLVSNSRLFRVTTTGVHASNQAWMFSGVGLSTGEPVDLEIATLGTAHHDHVTSTGGVDALEVTLDPAPVAEPALTKVLSPGTLSTSTAEERAAALEAVGRLEDPTRHDPGTVDCASCHVAALTRSALAARGAALESPVSVPEVYKDTRVMRAFGYFFTEPALSPRVQREAAAVHAALAADLDGVK